MKRLLPFLLLFSVLLQAEPRRPAINVYVPELQERYGDIAANFWMAYLLKLSLPEMNINLIIQKKHPKLEEAVSRFADKDYRSKVNIVEEGEIPKAELIVSFSVSMDEREKGLPKEILDSAPISLIFREHDRKSAFNVQPIINERDALLNSGIHFGGLYVSPANLPGNQGLGDSTFCYPRTINGLNRALEFYSNEGERKKKVKVLLTELPSDGIVRHPNLEIEVVNRMPFLEQLSQVRKSELPPLVSGDVSLGVATQCERPFIFEPPAYKYDYGDELFDWLVSESGNEDKFRARLIQNHAPNPSIPNLNDSAFESVFQAQLRKIRKEHSLVTTVVKTWMFMDERLGKKTSELFRRSCSEYLIKFESVH